MYHIIWFLFIFDRLPEMTGENTEQREEYLTRTDRKSIADKGNLKVVLAEIWKWLREILFEEQRKSRCEEKYDWLSSSCAGCSNTDTANTPIRGRGRKGCMCVKGLLLLLSSISTFNYQELRGVHEGAIRSYHIFERFLPILPKQNTALLSHASMSQTWHLNFSQ